MEKKISDNAKLQEESVCKFSYFFDMLIGHNRPQTFLPPDFIILRKRLI